MLDTAGDYEAQVALVSRELERLVRRLRALSPLGWRSRREPVEAVLRQLETVTAEIEVRPVAEIPGVVEYALADAVAVIGHDAVAGLATARDEERIAAVATALRLGLDRTR